MPLWSNPYEGQGVLPAQAQFYAPKAIDPRMIASIVAQQQARQQAIPQAIQQGLAGYQQLMQERQRDKIANTLLAAQTTGQQVTPEALKAASTTGPFGFVSESGVPDLGGMQTYNAYNQQLDAASKRFLLGAQAAHYLGYGQKPEEPMVDVELPGGQKLTIKQSQAASLYSSMSGHQHAETTAEQKQLDEAYDAKLKTASGGFGLDVFKNVATDTPYTPGNPRTVFYAKKGDTKVKPVAGDDPDVVANPGNYVAVFSSGGKQKASIPLPDYFATQKVLGEYQQKRNVLPTAGGPSIKITPHAAAQGGGGAVLPVTEAFAQARAAEKAGAPHDAVVERLKAAGYDTTHYTGN